MALLAVIGVTVAVTVSVTSGGGDGGRPAPTGETYGLASADDTGPVNIITEDPSCAVWIPVNNTLVEIEEKGWNKRDIASPASEWSTDVRRQYEEVRQAMLSAADETVPLVRVTPHRVVRELYEQFIAYARAYADAIPTYTEPDNHLVGTVAAASIALVHLCTTISNGSAAARSPLVAPGAPPTKLAHLADPSDPTPFMREPDATCPEWDRLLNDFAHSTTAWQALDASIPASEWTPEQRKVVEAVIPLMESFADDVEDLGQRSQKPVIQDFSALAAQYRRAYAEALPTYSPADSYLSGTSANAASTIYESCAATGV